MDDVKRWNSSPRILYQGDTKIVRTVKELIQSIDRVNDNVPVYMDDGSGIMRLVSVSTEISEGREVARITIAGSDI